MNLCRIQILIYPASLIMLEFVAALISVVSAQTPIPVQAGFFGGSLNAPQSVFVSGNYAYCANTQNNSLEIVDISNPTAPVHAGSLLSHVGGALLDLPYSIFVSGNYAYVASYNNDALEIVDVTNPTAPVHKGSIGDNSPNGALLSTPSCVYVSGNYAYVVGPNSHALEIVDVTNPASPLHKGSAQLTTGQPYAVFVSGSYAYVASQGEGLIIIDVSDPTLPTITSHISDSDGGAMLIKPYAIYVVEPYAYVASSTSNALEIIDVSNKSAPVHKGSIVNGGATLLDAPRSLFVLGDYAYIGSQFSYALEIVNVHDPALPVHAASLSLQPYVDNPHSVFVLGNYAYVTGNDGLEVISIYTLAPPHAVLPDEITNGSFVAKWDAVKYATGGYYLDVSIDNFSTFVSGFYNSPQSDTSVKVPRINGTTPYQYRVRAANANGPSTNSNIVEILPTPFAKDATEISQNGFKANWIPVAVATGYNIDVSVDSSFSANAWPATFSLSTDNDSTFVIDFASLDPYFYHYYNSNNHFYYRVRSSNVRGVSVWSNVVNVLTLPTNPVVKPFQLFDYNRGQVGAYWSVSDGCNCDTQPSRDFFIDVAKDSLFRALIAGYANLPVLNRELVSYASQEQWTGVYYTVDLLNLNPDSTYYFRVRSSNASGVSGNSNATKIDPGFYPPVAKMPTEITDSSFLANWSEVSYKGPWGNGPQYLLTISRDNFVTYESLLTSGTSAHVEQLNPSTPYKFKVNAFYKDPRFPSGVNGNYSNVIDVATLITGLNSLQEPTVLYPNPAHESFYIDGIQNNVTESFVIDMVGKSTIIPLERQQELLKADVSKLCAGLYLLEIICDSRIHHFKFIKQ